MTKLTVYQLSNTCAPSIINWITPWCHSASDIALKCMRFKIKFQQNFNGQCPIAATAPSPYWKTWLCLCILATSTKLIDFVMQQKMCTKENNSVGNTKKLCPLQKLIVAVVEKGLFQCISWFSKRSQVDLQLRGRGTGRIIPDPVKLRRWRNIILVWRPSITVAENADKQMTLGHFTQAQLQSPRCHSVVSTERQQLSLHTAKSETYGQLHKHH